MAQAMNITRISKALANEIISGTCGEDLTSHAYKVCYVNTSGKFVRADKDAASTLPAIVMVLVGNAADAVGTFLRRGIITNAAWTWTAADILYVGDDGALVAAKPGSTDYAQIVAQALSATQILFDPNWYVEAVA